MSILASIDDVTAGARQWDERQTVARLYADWLSQTLPRQVLDGSIDDGAFDEYDHGWRDGRWSAFTLARLVAARSWADEIGINPQRLEMPIRRAAAFLLRRQSPRGELDLGGAYSPIEVGFTVPGLVRAYQRMEAFPELTGPREQLGEFLRKATPAVLRAEALTANHRWAAVCAALAALNTLWPNKAYVDRIEQYLSDGIDCDEDGLWHIERCPNYANVANHGLIVMANCLGRPELLDHVVRSCQLLPFMLQPNGEADTSFSHRQSRAAPNVKALSYACLRFAAIRSGDGRIASLARRALGERTLGDMLYPLPFVLDDHPHEQPAELALPEQYDLHLESPQIARRRADQTALTLAADSGGHFFDSVRDSWGGLRRSDDWLHLHHGSIVLQSIQLAIGGVQNLQPDWLEVDSPGHYRLGGCREGWKHTLHFRPGWPQIDMHWGLSHSINVDHEDEVLRVGLVARATNALVANLRLFIRAGATISGGGVDRQRLEAGQTIDLGGGEELELSNGPDRITISGLPQAAHHAIIVHAEPIPSVKSEHCAVLSLGLRMPVDLKLQLFLHPRTPFFISSQSATVNDAAR